MSEIKKATEVTKRKMSEAASRRVGSKNSFYGRNYSDETRAKIAATKKRSACAKI